MYFIPTDIPMNFLLFTIHFFTMITNNEYQYSIFVEETKKINQRCNFNI